MRVFAIAILCAVLAGCAAPKKYYRSVQCSGMDFTKHTDNIVFMGEVTKIYMGDNIVYIPTEKCLIVEVGR